MSKKRSKVQVSVYQQSKSGEVYCGDSYYYKESNNKFICVLVDGLGSGKLAAESSEIVIHMFKKNIDQTNEQIMKKINKQLSSKRGVVLGILKIDFDAHKWTFSSIGNIGLLVITSNREKIRSIPSTGYLASYPREFNVFQRALENGMNFIMFSDGVMDQELSNRHILTKDVNDLVKMFSPLNDSNRKDDTTLIAMRYVQ